MSVVLFANNSDSGNGSLRAALASAAPGDVIRPDETVFERGSTIEIALASQLIVDKNLTLDASPFRVRLDGGGTVGCAQVVAPATFTAFEFTASSGPAIAATAATTFARCIIAGANGAGVSAAGCEATINDSVICGNNGSAFVAATATLSGSTVVGNAAVPSVVALSAVNSVLQVGTGAVGDGNAEATSSAFGFVAPPPDELTSETWSVDLWKNWDLRLLDDASSSPSPYCDTGNVDNTSRYDVDGNFRGRATDGATTCSPGAYETLQADLFWVGKNATGATVETPSFLTSDGWATSRFADASGDAAPQVGQTVFVDGNVHFVDVLSTSSAQTFGLTVGGGAVIAIDATSRTYFGALQLSANASFTSTSSLTPRTSTRCGAWSRLVGSFAAEKPCDFDDGAYIANAIFYSVYVPSAATYGALKIATSSLNVIRLSGEYVCDVFSTSQNGTATGQTIMVSDDGATIRARAFQFGGANASNYVESFFDRPVTLKLQGAASVSFPSTRRESWFDDFLVDVSEAASATLSLNGQIVYGDASSAAVSLSGSVKVAERGLHVAGLTVADDANVEFVGGNAVLSVNENATLGAATFSGVGYFATPPGTDATAATFDETIRVCDYGAGLQTFAVTSAGKSIVCRWTAESLETPVLIEKQNDAVWEVAQLRADGGEATFTAASSGNATYRAFDGATFLQTSIYIEPFHAWLTYDNLFTSAIVVKSYTVVTELILMSSYFNAGEAPVFLARVADSYSSVPVVPTDVESIALTVYKTEFYRGVKRRVTLDDWVDVAVPSTSVTESLVVDDPRWKRDSVGYNFRYEPDLREKGLFKDAGDYVAVITMRFKEGNPAPIVFNISVK